MMMHQSSVRNDGRPMCALNRLHVRVLLRSDNWHWTHSQATLIRSSWHWEFVEFGDTFCEHHKIASLPTGRAIFAFSQMRSCPCDESSERKKSKQIKMVNKWRWRRNPNRKLEHQMSTDGQPLAFHISVRAKCKTLDPISYTYITITISFRGFRTKNHYSECGTWITNAAVISPLTRQSHCQMSNHPNINSVWLCRAIQYHSANSATVTANKKMRFAIPSIYEYLEYWQWWAKWIE